MAASRALKCEFSGCKKPAAWECRKLWGKGGTIHTCADHRPGNKAHLLKTPPPRPFYDCKPIAPAEGGD